MKKTFLLLMTFLWALSALRAQCPDYLQINTQSEIDLFPINYPNCTEINGMVMISGDDISNLNGLSNLISISGYLSIRNTILLEDLSGLDNLSHVGLAIEIMANSGLTSLHGLENLGSTTDAFNMYVEENESLINLSGLDNLTNLEGDFFIMSNNGLINLHGLESLNSVGWFILSDNANLTSLEGLENLQIVKDFDMGQNGSLMNLNGLNGLNEVSRSMTITNHNSLTSLEGLESLKTVRQGLYIWANNALADNLNGLNNLTYVQDLVIQENYFLQSLSGLDRLDSVGRDLNINNCNELEDLHGLESISYLGGALKVDENNALVSLSGIDSLPAESIASISITFNPMLSHCEVKSVCDYLASPNGDINVYVNSAGCNNSQEIIDACTVSTGKDREIVKLGITHHASTRMLSILNPDNGRAQLKIYNQLGQLVISRSGFFNEVDISTLQSGIHVAQLASEDQKIRQKLIVF
ncbi:MAG: T9SS type A sorting domain-containing protein [Bacteroidales bacterium]|nr:T9SS type A sorting domain-containing protein [Bacteroidales bacterium]